MDVAKVGEAHRMLKEEFSDYFTLFEMPIMVDGRKSVEQVNLPTQKGTQPYPPHRHGPDSMLINIVTNQLN